MGRLQERPITSIFLFPGINCILREKDRNRVLAYDSVTKRLDWANDILRHFDTGLDIKSHLQTDPANLSATKNFHLTAIGTLAVQMGICDALSQRHIFPQWLMGCSLGDLTRSVYGGIIGFEQAIKYQYGRLRDHGHCDTRYSGVNFGIRAPVNSPFTTEDIHWFESCNLEVSQMSPRFLQLSCDSNQSMLLLQRARSRGWRLTKTEFDFMFHTSRLKQLSDSALQKLERTNLRNPEYQVFSSVLTRPLRTLSEFREEAMQIIWKPLMWVDAIRCLQNQYGIQNFINIGPCRSLSVFQREILPGCRAMDAWTLIEARK